MEWPPMMTWFRDRISLIRSLGWMLNRCWCPQASVYRTRPFKRLRHNEEFLVAYTWPRVDSSLPTYQVNDSQVDGSSQERIAKWISFFVFPTQKEPKGDRIASKWSMHEWMQEKKKKKKTKRKCHAWALTHSLSVNLIVASISFCVYKRVYIV
jgi:hypothetical protein